MVAGCRKVQSRTCEFLQWKVRQEVAELGLAFILFSLSELERHFLADRTLHASVAFTLSGASRLSTSEQSLTRRTRAAV